MHLAKNEILLTHEAIDLAFRNGLDASEHEYGLYGALLDMVYLSAPITHPNGNRRYENWIFRLVNSVVVSVHFIKCETCEDKRRVQVETECPKCHGAVGQACNECHGSGNIDTSIPCDSCC